MWIPISKGLKHLNTVFNKRSYHTAISRPGGYEVYRLASNMPKSQKSCKPLQANFLSLLQSNQKKILKRGMIWKEQKLKETTFKVQSIALANQIYIDLIHQWPIHSGPLCPAPKKIAIFYVLSFKREQIYSCSEVVLEESVCTRNICLSLSFWRVGVVKWLFRFLPKKENI